MDRYGRSRNSAMMPRRCLLLVVLLYADRFLVLHGLPSRGGIRVGRFDDRGAGTAHREDLDRRHDERGARRPGRRRQQSEEVPEYYRYELWEPFEIQDALAKWQKHYPDFVRVETAQEAYGLPAAGGPDDCPFDAGRDGCLNYFVTIQDFVAHPEGSESSNRLPEVLWSGELHGNERVGPTAVLEAARLLLEAAACEGDPRAGSKGTEAYREEAQNALACRDEFGRRGFTDGERRWLARLVSTRRIVVVPTANALGYYRNQRTEGTVDPNRDFPYDLEDFSLCMQTVAGRTLNEIFREHMFQLSLTFHGGMEVIGYEWGAPSWENPKSPDDTAQKDIAGAYSRYGGGWSESKPYKYGNMNEFVYPVRGGMEDWAYAASWDADRVRPCTPKTFGGYDANKTTYGPGTLRAFNMLVESSDAKIPVPDLLGTSQQVLHSDSKGTGYVSRNVRLSLLAAELVQPYVAIRGVNELQLSDDVVPLSEPVFGKELASCIDSKAVSVPANSLKVLVHWTVGGALSIDSTTLYYAKLDDIPKDKIRCGATYQQSTEDVKKFMKKGEAMSDTKGKGRFSGGGPSPPFVARIDISDGFGEGDRIVVLASAVVDQSWARAPNGAVPHLPPQSHIVNARTNSSWRHESAGKIIQGRLVWFSEPLTILLRKPSDVVEAIELSSRFREGDANDDPSTPVEPNKTKEGGGDETTSESTSNSTAASADKEKPGLLERLAGLILVASLVLLIFFLGKAFLRYRLRKAQRGRVREYIEDDAAPTPGLQQKHQEQVGPSHKGKSGYSDIPAADQELEMGVI